MNWGFFGGAGNPTTGPPTNRTDSRKPNDTRTNDRDRSASSRKHPSNNEGYQIYVGELDIGINKQQLLEPFKKKYHSAFDSKIITDPATKLSKGYGFVQFSNYEESQKAIAEMQGFMIRGKPIKVSPGFSRNSMNPGSATGKSGSSTNQSRFSTQKGGINGPGGVFALGAGTMLGGLGVQIKSPENPTQTSIMGLAAGSQQFGILPGQMQPTHQVGLQNAGLGTTQGLYAQTLAEQQKLLYYQALLSGGNLANNPQAAQLLSLAAQGQQLQMNPSGMYGAQGLSLLAGSHFFNLSKPNANSKSALPDHAAARCRYLRPSTSRKPLGNSYGFRHITSGFRCNEGRAQTLTTASTEQQRRVDDRRPVQPPPGSAALHAESRHPLELTPTR